MGTMVAGTVELHDVHVGIGNRADVEVESSSMLI